MPCELVETRLLTGKDHVVKENLTPYEVACHFNMTVGEHIRMQAELNRCGVFHINNQTYVKLMGTVIKDFEGIV